MPTAIDIALAPEDELLLLDFMQRFPLTFYPDRIPPDFEPFPVHPDSQVLLTEPAYYMAAEELGEVHIHIIKKGKDRGWSEIDESISPVIHYERSVFDELGQLRTGQLWTELNVIGDVQRNSAFPESYRRMWMAMREHLLSRCHRSQPAGYLVGGQAARLSRNGTLIREAGRKGELLKPYR